MSCFYSSKKLLGSDDVKCLQPVSKVMTEKWIVLTHKKSKKYIDNQQFYFIL